MRIHLEYSSGFTLLELLTAIVVLGVLLAVGVPSFTETIRNNRTAAQTNELVTGLNIARGEAVKRSLPVTVCAADSAQAACAGATTSSWSNGWLIFVDQAGTAGVVDTGDQILLVSPRASDGVGLTSNNLGFVRYGPTGALMNAGSATAGTTVVSFALQHQRCSGTNRRVLNIDRTGHANLLKVTCS